MQQSFLTILENKEIAPLVYRMVLVNPGVNLKPGQFLDLRVPGKSLRRPISICSYNEKTIELVYKVVGQGTKILSEMTGEVEALLPCGNGFDLSLLPDTFLVAGGGIGTATMIAVIEEALKEGRKVYGVFGFHDPSQAFYEDRIKALGIPYSYCYDVDGTNAVKEMVRLGWDKLPFAACGPMVMLKALANTNSASGLLSLETRMGCGFGACMGCSMKFKDGMKRICKEGPVFEKEEILWEN